MKRKVRRCLKKQFTAKDAKETRHRTTPQVQAHYDIPGVPCTLCGSTWFFRRTISRITSHGYRPHLQEDPLETQELARTIVDMLEERQASDILLLDVSKVTILADYFILCSANSERQLKAISGDLSRQLKGDVGRPLAVEGEPESGWVLIDYGDVVVHLFLPEVRRYYALEELWKAAQTLVRIQ